MKMLVLGAVGRGFVASPEAMLFCVEGVREGGLAGETVVVDGARDEAQSGEVLDGA